MLHQNNRIKPKKVGHLSTGEGPSNLEERSPFKLEQEMEAYQKKKRKELASGYTEKGFLI